MQISKVKNLVLLFFCLLPILQTDLLLGETAKDVFPFQPNRSSSALETMLTNGPVYFKWTEIIFKAPVDNSGGLVFQKSDNKIISRAWFSGSREENAWPPVQGIGVIKDGKLEVVYRSASPDPHHAFYHAYVTYEFSQDFTRFRCDFLQKDDPKPEEELAPGIAEGTLLKSPPKDYLDQWKALQNSKVESVKVKENCPVLNAFVMDQKINWSYQGKIYFFCCSSCRDVFQRNPEAFIKKGKAPSPKS